MEKNKKEGECVFRENDCDDGKKCTLDTCDPLNHGCQHSPLPDCECVTEFDCPDGYGCCPGGDRPNHCSKVCSG
mgnify:CR=1 FL=1